MKKKIICILASCALAFALYVTLIACGNPSDRIIGIEVTRSPDKTVYIEGQTFSPEGMTVKAIYGDESKKPIKDYSFAPDAKTPLTKDVQEVTIRYEGFETTVRISVSERAVASLTVSKRPDKIEYNAGEAFDPAGMELKAVYNDGSAAKVTASEIGWERTGNENDIRISYGGASTIQPLRRPREAKNFGDAILSSDNTTRTGTVNFWTPGDWQPFADDKTMKAPTLQSDGTLKFTDENRMRFEAFRVPCKRWTDTKYHDGMDNIAADVGDSLDGKTFAYSLNVRSTGDYEIALFANATLKLDYTGSYATSVRLGHIGDKFVLKTTEGSDIALASAPDAATGYNAAADAWNRIDFEFTRKENFVTVKVYVDCVRICFNDDSIESHANARLEEGNFVFPAGKHDNTNTPEGITNYKNCGHRICVAPVDGAEVYLGKIE